MRPVFRGARLALFQLETPLDTVAGRAGTGAGRKGSTPFSIRRPRSRCRAALLERVDILTPNESEALRLAGPGAGARFARGSRRAGGGFAAHGTEDRDRQAGRSGLPGPRRRRRSGHVPGFPVEVKDTTAAGDTFNAGLAVALAEGAPLEHALRFANAAAAISVTRLGAQASAPARREVDAFLDGRPVSA